ncbi:MAG: response regulator [Candidatus Micrarchaeota archaeon]
MKRILIIEDEPDVAQSIKMYLENEGYSVEFTLDAGKGIKMMKKFDLLLLDLIMPKLSGRTVLREMKEQGIKKPVVVLSAVGLPEIVGAELVNEFPNLLFVPKTEMHAQLLPAIKKALSG